MGYRVTLRIFQKKFVCQCRTAESALEAVHAAHYALMPEIGPAFAMTEADPHFSMYQTLSDQLREMPQRFPFNAETGFAVNTPSIRAFIRVQYDDDKAGGHRHDAV